MPKFTVDTHLFRELGEFLVGRDSTALLELIKNAYDADATTVVVQGERLNEPDRGVITVTDNGVGMTPAVFEKGFLRIASRLKEQGERRSQVFNRRFTGAKGVGRLAAHKLAWNLAITSIANLEVYGERAKGVQAKIDWKKVEEKETLDDVEDSDALRVDPIDTKGRSSGTLIRLEHLKRKWSTTERNRFYVEAATFQPPAILIEAPGKTIKSDPLFDRPKVRDSKRADPGIRIDLTGDLLAGEEFWATVRDASEWLIEVETTGKKIHVQLSPTRSTLADYPHAKTKSYSFSLPEIEQNPRFQARIYYKGGQFTGGGKDWARRASGVRVYLEGFRVLPYADPGDDWLELDSDYRARGKKSLRFLDKIETFQDDQIEAGDVGLLFAGNPAYFGAVFLTSEGGSDLQLLVNREGFLPNSAYYSMRDGIRAALDLLVRERAIVTYSEREAKRLARQQSTVAKSAAKSTPKKVREIILEQLAGASEAAKEALHASGAKEFGKASKAIGRAGEAVAGAIEAAQFILIEPTTTRILAALGLQMAAFVHEINNLLGSVRQLQELSAQLRKMPDLRGDAKELAARLAIRVKDLLRAIERQAVYLADVTSVDTRRRRARQPIADRLDSAIQLLKPEAGRMGVDIQNRIPRDLKTPEAMFAPEVMLIFTNLLSNALKAVNKDGKILARARDLEDEIRIRIENTGDAIDLEDAERWFKPFESTTQRPDPYLGQGMGMGLPITRNLLEEYGASINFVNPSDGFSTAIRIRFPKG